MVRKRWLILAVTGLVVTALGGGWLLWWQAGRYVEETNDAYLRADDVTIAPKVMGYVSAILVHENQTVSAGQPLVRIDARAYAADVERLEADVEAKRAELDFYQAEIDHQRAAVDQSKAQAQAARVDADLADRQLRHYTTLATQGWAVPAKVQELEAASRRAAANVQANSAASTQAARQIETLSDQQKGAGASLRSASASLAQARVQLEGAAIASPIAGRVADLTGRLGQYVQPGAHLMSVVPVQDVYVVANFKETQVGGIRPGQAAEVRVDALPGAVLRGRVESLAPGTGAQFALLPPDNATGNFVRVVQRVPVRIRLLDVGAAAGLLPGLSASVKVFTPPNSNVSPADHQ